MGPNLTFWGLGGPSAQLLPVPSSAAWHPNTQHCNRSPQDRWPPRTLAVGRWEGSDPGAVPL